MTRIFPNMGPRGLKTTLRQKLAHLATSGARSFSSYWSLAAFILGYSLRRRLLELGPLEPLFSHLLAGKMTGVRELPNGNSAHIGDDLYDPNGAILLNNFLVLSAVPDAVGDWIGSLALSSTAILFIIF